MKVTVFEVGEIMGCLEDMNKDVFNEYNSIQIQVNGLEIQPHELKIIVYNDENQK